MYRNYFTLEPFYHNPLSIFIRLRSTVKKFIFDGLDYLKIFIYLMPKRYDELADNLVNIDNAFLGRNEAIALMKERTKKVALPVINKYQPALEQ